MIRESCDVIQNCLHGRCDVFFPINLRKAITNHIIKNFFVRDCYVIKMDEFCVEKLEEAVKNTDSFTDILCRMKNTDDNLRDGSEILPGAQFDEKQTFVDKNGSKYTITPLIVDFKRLLLCDSAESNNEGLSQMIAGVCLFMNHGKVRVWGMKNIE